MRNGAKSAKVVWGKSRVDHALRNSTKMDIEENFEYELDYLGHFLMVFFFVRFASIITVSILLIQDFIRMYFDWLLPFLTKCQQIPFLVTPFLTIQRETKYVPFSSIPKYL